MDVFALTMRLREQGAATVDAAVARMRKSLRDTAKDGQKLSDVTSGLSDQFKALAGSIAAAAGGAAALKAVDTYASMNNQLKLATKSAAELASAQADVIRIAQQTNQPVENVAALYGRVSMAAGALGLKQQDIAKLTQTVSQALIVSGSDAGAAAGALTQLGQALAAGTVRAEEFNSMLEGAPALIQAVEKDLGLLPGQLRKMATEGKLSSDVFAQALIRNTSVAEKFGQMVPTITQQLVGLRNQFVLITGRIAESTGAVAAITNGLTWLKTNLPTVAGLVGALAAVFVTYKATIMAAAVATAVFTSVETIGAFFSLAKGVRDLAAATALLGAVGGSWLKLAAVIAGATVGLGSFLLIQQQVEKAMTATTAAINQQVQQTTYLKNANASLHAVLQPTIKSVTDVGKAGKSTAELLVELADVAPLTLAQFSALYTEEQRLTQALNAGNLSLEKRVALEKQRAAVRAAREGATVNAPGLDGVTGKPVVTSPTATVDAIGPSMVERVRATVAGASDIMQTEAVRMADQLRTTMADMFADTLVSGIESAFETLGRGGSIGEAFKSLGSTLIAGLGSMLQTFGRYIIATSKIMAAIRAAFMSMNPVAQLAAGVALVALGSAMKGMAQSTFGGGMGGTPSAQVGGGIGGLGTGSGLTTTRFQATTAGTDGRMVRTVQPMNVTIIGPNDPNAQRQIATLMDNAARRGLVQGAQLRTG